MSAFLDLFSDPRIGLTAKILGASLCIILSVRVIRSMVRKKVTDDVTRYRASKLASVVGYFGVALVVAAGLAGQFSGLAVVLGAASAGIAFSLQEVIASIAGWLAIALGSYYKVGDRVQLGGIKGDVIDIGFVRTTVMEIGGWVKGDLYNGRIVRIANSFVFKEPVFNYSGEFPFVWDEIVVPVRYGSDYEAARAIMLDVADSVVGEYAKAASARWHDLARSYRIEEARVSPVVTLEANDNWVEFTLRYIVDHRARRATKDVLSTRILQAVEASQGRVVPGSTTLQIVGAPPLRVTLDDSERTK